jgi:hypothetical protein
MLDVFSKIRQEMPGKNGIAKYSAPGEFSRLHPRSKV